jgi:NAD(P)-dependent dehydrogenase (short-subunit alcohol dehydrogenase family)
VTKAKTRAAHAGGATAAKHRAIQREQDARDQAKSRQGGKRDGDKAAQAGARVQPSELPAQHLDKPGLEADLALAPRFLAPDYKGSGKLEGKVAIVTGGDSGIGRAVAVLFAREGADVGIVYLDEHRDARDTKKHVEAEGRRCVIIPGDVKDSGFCEQAVEEVVRKLGHLDVLVNNAAFQEHAGSLEDITDERLDETLRTNVGGYFFMARAAIPHLKRGAAIINTGSVVGLEGSAELLDYAATKGAIHAFTKSLAENLVERRIRVNCVSPGPIWTPFIPSTSAKKAKEHGEKVPMKRPGQPEEVAPAYVFFASNADTSYITGEVLTVLGGEITAA